MLAAYLNRWARRLDRAFPAVDFNLSVGIVRFLLLRNGPEFVLLAGLAAVLRLAVVSGLAAIFCRRRLHDRAGRRQANTGEECNGSNR